MKRFLMTVVLSALGCTPPPTGVQGGILMPYGRLSQKPDQVYSPGPCRDRDGGPAPGADGVEYEWRGSEGSSLFEHSLNEEEGRLIRNSWTENSDVHYFVWLTDVRGFEYVIPSDRQRPAERRIYSHPQVRPMKSRTRGGPAYRPVGRPDIVCQLLPLR